MPDIATDPAAAAAQLREWADDETLKGVMLTKGDCRRLAELLAKTPKPFEAPAVPAAKPKDDPEPSDHCGICGARPPADGSPCGFDQCPILANA